MEPHQQAYAQPADVVPGTLRRATDPLVVRYASVPRKHECWLMRFASRRTSMRRGGHVSQDASWAGARDAWAGRSGGARGRQVVAGQPQETPHEQPRRWGARSIMREFQAARADGAGGVEHHLRGSRGHILVPLHAWNAHSRPIATISTGSNAVDGIDPETEWQGLHHITESAAVLTSERVGCRLQFHSVPDYRRRTTTIAANCPAYMAPEPTPSRSRVTARF